MTRFPADPDFEPRVADWLEEDPDSAPGAVLATVLAALPLIPQRRASRVPWRYPMNSFARLAVAAVAVIAVGTVGFIALRPQGTTGVGSSPSSSPPPAASPSTPPALSETFTSPSNGISMAYPQGWSTRPATAPWTTGWPNFDTQYGDFLYDPSLNDHLFIVVASQPVAGTSGDQWAADALAVDECVATEPVTIDGAVGLAAIDCTAAAIVVDGRGYLIALVASPDEPWLSEAYDRAWFERLLATIDLRPGDAAGASASP